MSQAMPAGPAAAERPALSTWKQFTLSFYWLTWNTQWTAIIFILMPLQVLAMVGEENKAFALGMVTAIGATISLVLPPFIGALSDRTRTPMGRRRPFLLSGAILNGAALILMAFIPIWFGMPWAIVFYVLAVMFLQLGSSWATAPYAALIPDVVPAFQLGVASGWLGLMTLLGNFLGNLIGGFGVGSLGMAGTYGLLFALLAVGVLVTLLGVREPDPPPVEPFVWGPFLKQLLDPLKDHNFRWVFVTRMLVVGGQWTAQAFLLFYFRDKYFSSGEPQSFLGLTMTDAQQGLAIFLTMVLLGALPSAWLSGYLSDRVGRKPMVYLACGLMSVVVVLFTFNFIDLFSAVLWLGLVFGMGYGAFTSVDWALACDVLPSDQDYAKDMGVWHIASMVPQVFFIPVAGFLLDRFTQVGESLGKPFLGYTVIFSFSCVLFILGTVFLSRIRGVR